MEVIQVACLKLKGKQKYIWVCKMQNSFRVGLFKYLGGDIYFDAKIKINEENVRRENCETF